MSAPNDGGPAFPCDVEAVNPLNGLPYRSQSEGMALRDWFAGQALPAVIEVCEANERVGDETIAQMFARKAYEAADAMLNEREP